LEEEEKAELERLKKKNLKNDEKPEPTGSQSEEESEQERIEPKYVLPPSCKLEISKLNKVEKLDDDYILVANPFPQMEGEMLLFQTKPSEQDDSCIFYKDYSLRKRWETSTAKLTSYQKKKITEADHVKTKIQCLEIDMESPLSFIDWDKF